MAGPGVRSGRVADTVARGIDVAPTLLDLAGRPVPASMEGRSLRGASAGPLPDAPAYVESEFAHRQLGWAPLHGWRTARFKLIDAPRPELYALATDPKEEQNRFDADRDDAARLERALQAAMATRPPKAAREEDREAEERLRALGYVGGGATGSGPGGPAAGTAGRDPKDGIGLLRRVERGLAEARSNPDLAISELSAAIAEDPAMALAWRYRAIAQAERRDFPAAIADLRRSRRTPARPATTWSSSASACGAPAAPPESLPVLRPRGRTAAGVAGASPRPGPRAAQPRPRPEAARAYERILAAVPEQPEALRGLADLALAGGDAARAAAPLRADPARRSRGRGRARQARRRGDARRPRRRSHRVVPPGGRARPAQPGGPPRPRRRARPQRPGRGGGARTSSARWRPGRARRWRSTASASRASSPATRAGALAALRESLALDPRQAQVAAAVADLAAGRAPGAPGEPAAAKAANGGCFPGRGVRGRRPRAPGEPLSSSRSRYSSPPGRRPPGGRGVPPRPRQRRRRSTCCWSRSTRRAPTASAATATRAARTRHLDRLAAEGVRFEQARSARRPSPCPRTPRSSPASIPFAHGVRNNGNFYLADRFDDPGHAC